jgi:hypothetical protein
MENTENCGLLQQMQIVMSFSIATQQGEKTAGFRVAAVL